MLHSFGLFSLVLIAATHNKDLSEPHLRTGFLRGCSFRIAWRLPPEPEPHGLPQQLQRFIWAALLIP